MVQGQGLGQGNEGPNEAGYKSDFDTFKKYCSIF